MLCVCWHKIKLDCWHKIKLDLLTCSFRDWVEARVQWQCHREVNMPPSWDYNVQRHQLIDTQALKLLDFILGLGWYEKRGLVKWHNFFNPLQQFLTSKKGLKNNIYLIT